MEKRITSDYGMYTINVAIVTLRLGYLASPIFHDDRPIVNVHYLTLTTRHARTHGRLKLRFRHLSAAETGLR